MRKGQIFEGAYDMSRGGRGRISKKIKSILKKWQRLARVGRSYSSLRSNPATDDERSGDGEGSDFEPATGRRPYEEAEALPEGYQAVFVGKSRRRYVVSARHLNHPLLRVLIQKSQSQPQDSYDDRRENLTVACEVVLFEHLLWMLENAHPLTTGADSVDELAELYAC